MATGTIVLNATASAASLAMALLATSAASFLTDPGASAYAQSTSAPSAAIGLKQARLAALQARIRQRLDALSQDGAPGAVPASESALAPSRVQSQDESALDADIARAEQMLQETERESNELAKLKGNI